MNRVTKWNWGEHAVIEDNYTLLAQGDIKADSFSVVSDSALTGKTCAANFIRADGVTVQLTGTVSGTTAAVELTEDCLYYEGAFTLAIFISDSAHRCTARVVSGRVVRTQSERILDKGAAYDLASLRAQIAAKVPRPAGAGNVGDVLVTDGAGGTSWANPATATAAGILTVGGTDYAVRTGTGGAAGYITFVPEA